MACLCPNGSTASRYMHAVSVNPGAPRGEEVNLLSFWREVDLLFRAKVRASMQNDSGRLRADAHRKMGFSACRLNRQDRCWNARFGKLEVFRADAVGSGFFAAQEPR